MSGRNDPQAGLIFYQQNDVDAYVRTVQDKLRETISVLDFADPLGPDIRLGVADAYPAIDAALTYAGILGTDVFAPPGTYRSTQRAVVPAGVSFFGHGIKTKLVSGIPVGSVNGELVRLAGDHAAISGMWLLGHGQHPDATNGDRAVWIGNTADYIAEGRVSYARVENLLIEEFQGNGISGDLWNASLLNNTIRNTTDAGMFLPPTCSRNLLQGNTISGTRYCGIDINGSDNRILANFIEGCGGGNPDAIAWNGILLANVSEAKPCVLNLVEGNRLKDNLGCGVLVFGCTGVGITPAYGNTIRGNIATGHTNTVTGSPTHIPAGFMSLGGDHTLFEGNFAYGNRDNYVASGAYKLNSSTGVVFANNQSLNATRDGFLEIHSPQIALGGDFPPVNVVFRGNSEKGSGRDAYRFQPFSATFGRTTIADNRSDTPAGYCFNNTAPGSHNEFDFHGNYGFGTATYQTGFEERGFAGADVSPSVANGSLFHTNNASPTTVTSFDDGVVGQRIMVLVRDGNTTFNFTAGNLRGNAGSIFVPVNGDWLEAYFNGTLWYCLKGVK